MPVLLHGLRRAAPQQIPRRARSAQYPRRGDARNPYVEKARREVIAVLADGPPSLAAAAQRLAGAGARGEVAVAGGERGRGLQGSLQVAH